MYEKVVQYRAFVLYFAPVVCGALILLLLLLLGGDVTHPIKITIIVVFFVLSLGTAIAAAVREVRRRRLSLQSEGQEDVEFESRSGDDSILDASDPDFNLSSFSSDADEQRTGSRDTAPG